MPEYSPVCRRYQGTPKVRPTPGMNSIFLVLVLLLKVSIGNTTSIRYRKVKYVPVHAKYVKELRIKYTSIVHLWNEWYNAYANVTTFPRLIVRMEDLVFRADEVLPQICECFGGTWQNHHDKTQVRHQPKVANRNAGIDTGLGSGLLRSIIKYGNTTSRREHYQSMQLEAAKDILDPKLMALFGYKYEEP